jgi:hypothetical protein
MADTFEAIVRCPDCLRATIEKSPPTMDASIESFRVQQPFLADFADLSDRLRPAAARLPTALPKLNSALRVGTPVVRSSVTLNEETAKVFESLNYLVRDPNTLLALRDGRDAVAVLNPLVGYVAPYQTVCNYGVYFFTGLQGDVGFETAGGSAQAALIKSDTDSEQDNKMGEWTNDRPPDVPLNVDPRGAKYPQPGPEQPPWQRMMGPAYGPAIDAQGNADCQIGQSGYPSGPLNGDVERGDFDPTYRPSTVEDPSDHEQVDEFNRHRAGGSRTANMHNFPGLRGTTFEGVPHLKDVP